MCLADSDIEINLELIDNASSQLAESSSSKATCVGVRVQISAAHHYFASLSVDILLSKRKGIF